MQTEEHLKEKLMPLIALTLLTLLLLSLPGWSTDLNLFVIQRSKNTNEVQYQLHVEGVSHVLAPLRWLVQIHTD
jgi:hypothetical protein